MSAQRRPALPGADALLLLPALPQRVRLLGDREPWQAALEQWGTRVDSSGPGLWVGGTPRAAVGSGADVLLVSGRDRRGRLRRAGYHTRMYQAVRLPSGSVLIAPAGPRLPDPRPRRLWRDRQALRPLLRAVARRVLSGQRMLTVGAHDDPAPAALRHLPPAEDWELLVGTDPRRRAAFTSASAAAVTKVARGPDAVQRGEREQRVLATLQECGVGSVPRPLGTGRQGLLAWSCETRARGVPLVDLPAGTSASAAVLSLGRWSLRLATATRGVPCWSQPGEELPLRGAARELGPLLQQLPGVPGVLVHGDLASGTNVLVDGAVLTVVDWETARSGWPPLLDLLPTLCLGLARARGHTATEAQAAHALRLCRGEDEDSALLHAMVREHLELLAVPQHRAGRLAALAWGYQSSMRAVHDELVLAAGRQPVAWRSPGELVYDAWLGCPRLGLEWPSLADGPSR